MSASKNGTAAQMFLAEIAEADAKKPRLSPGTRAAIEAISRGECPTEASCDDTNKVRARQQWQGHKIEVKSDDHVGDGEGAFIK